MTVLYGALASAVLALASAAGSGWWFYGAGKDAEIAARSAAKAQEDRVVAAVEQAAQRSAHAAGAAIAKLEIKRVQITQPLQTEIRERVVYRDCLHSPAGLRAVNEALAGGASGGADRSQLPAPRAVD